ncbi:MAG: NAD-dependent epimerase/dehydratase family protein [Caldisphaeraceae archaeon]|nr:NAD-dependent epimerase/dehydratase family protein [Caldisphaeraceae archaeon]MEB3691407.1 NAD-dependent epimerase/dehydratase family protein [Caldisphaeraceae archaeon]MEB3797640.1 NAD-dependent epimerase/dehydratase family protein [Caldisphaeraceae archaeon]
MKGPIMIFGADGYIGWALALHLGVRYDGPIVLVDNFSTRSLVKSVKSDSLIPIKSMAERLHYYKEFFNKENLVFEPCDARDPEQVDEIISKYKPEAVVHLAQQRSAPFSMVDQEHVLYTEVNNVVANINIMFSISRHSPGAHLLKMGTLGEYGTPGIDITEGDIEIELHGRKAKVMFPRFGQSYYHLTKIFDTYNLLLANKLYNIRATDVMQGVVYGVKVDEIIDDALATRFDFDSNWGTVINKYVVQSVLLNELLIYGIGKQTRGFLSLYDSINALTLLLENPPREGEYRIVNQLDEIYNTLQLAEIVAEIANEYGINPSFRRIENPRVEAEEHYYNVEHKILPSLGFYRKKDIRDTIREIFEVVLKYKDRAAKMKELIYPTVRWKSSNEFRSELFPISKEYMRVLSREEIMKRYNVAD